MTHNPYAPPEAPVEGPAAVATDTQTVVASVPLYSATQIAVAAFIGTPIAAAWFGRANFKALAEPRKGLQTIFWGLGATIAIAALALVLPDSTPNSIVPLVYTFAIKVLADNQFSADIKRHLGAGGKLGSWWRVVGVSTLFLLGFVAVFGGLIVFLIMAGVLAE